LAEREARKCVKVFLLDNSQGRWRDGPWRKLE